MYASGVTITTLRRHQTSTVTWQMPVYQKSVGTARTTKNSWTKYPAICGRYRSFGSGLIAANASFRRMIRRVPRLRRVRRGRMCGRRGFCRSWRRYWWIRCWRRGIRWIGGRGEWGSLGLMCCRIMIWTCGSSRSTNARPCSRILKSLKTWFPASCAACSRYSNWTSRLLMKELPRSLILFPILSCYTRVPKYKKSRKKKARGFTKRKSSAWKERSWGKSNEFID